MNFLQLWVTIADKENPHMDNMKKKKKKTKRTDSKINNTKDYTGVQNNCEWFFLMNYISKRLQKYTHMHWFQSICVNQLLQQIIILFIKQVYMSIVNSHVFIKKGKKLSTAISVTLTAEFKFTILLKIAFIRFLHV